jgi:hypothetical protein
MTKKGLRKMNTLFKLRIRSGFEASDSGILVWRARPMLLLLFFAIPSVIPVIICYFIKLPDYKNPFTNYIMAILVVAFFLWWLKPLFDRFALQVVSKLFFNKNTPLKEIFKGLLKNVFYGLIGDLLWRRFSPVRSVNMPLRILEKPKRDMYKRRKDTLGSGGIGIFLTIMLYILEVVLSICCMVFVVIILDLADSNIISVMDGSVFKIISIIIIFVNYCIIETLYVSMGFAVYINSRVETEGWDLEIIFRQLAENGHKL